METNATFEDNVCRYPAAKIVTSVGANDTGEVELEVLQHIIKIVEQDDRFGTHESSSLTLLPRWLRSDRGSFGSHWLPLSGPRNQN